MFADLSPLETLSEVRSVWYTECDYTMTATAVAYFNNTSVTANLATYTFDGPNQAVQTLFVTWNYPNVALNLFTPVETVSFVCFCDDFANG